MQTLFLVGPTAVGKSAVALALARRLGAEIVSADSMQVYRGMDIGTAKPTLAERQTVPHHLLDVCDVSAGFDVKQYVESARRSLAEIHHRGRGALVVGGTGLYVRALRHGLFEGPGRDADLRARLEQMTAAALFEELQRVDSVTAARIDRQNPRRLVRALEVWYTTGKPIATWQTQWAAATDHGSRTTDHGSPITASGPAFCLTRGRSDLHARIERRIDAQLAAGWVEEVRGLLARGLERNPTALQAAGYRELAAHVRGHGSLAEATTRIKARTRQLARRQLTWFRREPELIWIEMEEDELTETTAGRIAQILSQSDDAGRSASAASQGTEPRR